MVFQSYALFPHMSVERNIAYGLPRGDNRAPRVAEMLELVDLRGLDRRYPHELSGGQQQRVALARALAPQPDVILLDEPFSNLDTGLRVQVREEVQRILQAADVSAILVTHDQDEAMSMADQVGVMFEGSIVQMGDPRTLFQAPVSRQVALFLGEANSVAGQAVGDMAETALGQVHLREPRQGPVEVLIRPDELALFHAGQGIPGTVSRVVYFGPHQNVWVTLADGLQIRATSRNGQSFQIGEHIRVSVSGPVLAFPAVP
jgi:iron(III) transport system ATP-binding protein